jgi:hypothetical protein
MNPQNYATLEAAKRLADAGIVLNTDAVWRKHSDSGYYLTTYDANLQYSTDIPAPSPAEALMELPAETYIKKMDGLFLVWVAEDGDFQFFDLANLTDALIALLIWTRKGQK